MTDNEKQINKIIDVLDDEGILKDVILIGSWCLFLYKKIYANYEPIIKTRDIDFYVPNYKAFTPKKSLVKSLKGINYDFLIDSLTNRTYFASVGGFELEFITRLNRNNLSCVRVGNTGIYAESLPYLEIFSSNYITVIFNNHAIKLANPYSYVIQKLLILEKRGIKKEKDIIAINSVLSLINSSSEMKSEFTKAFDSLPNKWKKKIIKNSNENGLKIF